MLQDIDPQFLHCTERYKQLRQLERYLEGTQYEELTGWYDETSNAPLRERAPCVIYPLPKAAVNQAVRFAIGEGKFPRLKVEEVEAADALTPELVLSKDDADQLTSSIDDLVLRGRLKSMFRTTMRRGLSARTGVTILSVREGRFHFEHPHAKDCVATFKNDDPDSDVLSLVWSYQFDQVERGDDGKPVSQRYAFRRDYDEINVTEYEDAKVETGKLIVWVVKNQRPHGLGYCPVDWTRNMPQECGSSLDGVSLYDGLLDELDALNYSLSKRHMGLEILGTPQPYETGVDDGDGPGATGRTAAPQPKDVRARGYSNPSADARRSVAARRSGAQYVWSYSGEGVKVGLVETTGKAFEVTSAHVNDIRSRLLEAMDVILLDPTTVAGKGDMSAKALSLMYAPLLALVDELREWWWEQSLNNILSMMLRAVAALGEGILVKGAKRLVEILKRRTIKVDGVDVWIPPTITPLWGEYFAPSAEEVKTNVDTATAAADGGLVSKSTAARFVANHFAVADIEAEQEQVDEEKAKAVEDAQAMMPAQPGQPQPGKQPFGAKPHGNQPKPQPGK